jgi:CheY-like chemotaxis protein
MERGFEILIAFVTFGDLPSSFLLHVNMPAMNGKETIEKSKNDDELK